ncbi:hypothetical protein SAMN05216466_106211 [Paraburkholderia phenazinium]|uniref:Uncharacterized protein n=1 Tax=Paraburkholderia phenazinium TaxID=60549 RepID=A0A1G7YIW0_9BURK|nr:hypothetical protein [Paraburkholderia phenazinium]SDG96508.1 hypothetical protein SAMN05216466_106211 [Paraburkholderia phenazinium]
METKETTTWNVGPKLDEEPIEKATALAVAMDPTKVKAPPYDRNAAAFIETLAAGMRADGAATLVWNGSVDRIRKNVLRQCAEYFGRKGVNTTVAPFDLQDKLGDSAVSSRGVPLVQVIKVNGDDCEIGQGGSSMAETALLYAHPLVTVASEALMAAGHMGLPGFVLTQASYAIGTLALLGRNWRYVVRPTAQYTLGITTIQTAASYFLGEYAGPIVAAGNALMLARPFLESFLNNRSGKERQFQLPPGYEKPNDAPDLAKRETQVLNAADFAKNGPVLVLAIARGDMKFLHDPLAPDAGMPLGISAHEDLSTHLLVIGQTGSGKTYGIMIPLAQQWLTMGTIRNGKFENCGGGFFLDGKGQLPDVIIAALMEQGLDKVLNIIRVSPEPGGQPIALLQGMTPDEVTAAMLEVNNTKPDEQDDFFKVSPGNWLSHSSLLLWECMRLEQLQLEAKAKKAGFANYQAWSDALDEAVRNKKPKSDGSSWGFTGWEQYVAWRQQKGLSVPTLYQDAMRHFRWYFAGLNDFTMFFMEDSLFISGMSPPAPAEGAAPLLPSIAPPVPAGNGIVGWLTTNHPDMIAGNSNGKLIQQSLTFARRELPGLRADLRSDIRATLSSWFTPIMRSTKLGHWAYLEHGCDILECLRGAVVGICLPETLYKKAGVIITTLAKKRVFNAIQARPEDWETKFPDQRPLLCMADEAQLLVSGANADERKMLSIARSLGLYCVYATQTVNEFSGRLGDDNAKAFMANFVSWVTLKSTEDSNRWANGRLKMQKVFNYTYYLTGGLKTLLSTDFQRQHEAALDDLATGQRELEPGKRLALLKRLRYDLSRPADVTLSKKDREALHNADDHSGRLPMSLLKLATMFTVGAVTTNVVEAVVGTGSLVKSLAKRTGNAMSRLFMGGTVKHDDYAPPSFNIDKKNGKREEDIDLFPKERWALLDQPRTAVVSINRGGVPRRDIATTIGKLSIAQIREYARLQGIPTIYDVMDARAAAEATKRAASEAKRGGSNDPTKQAA